MRGLVISCLVSSLASGCATYDYNNTNCAYHQPAHCDKNEDVRRSAGNKNFLIRENLLFVSDEGGSNQERLASREEVLDFALSNSEYVAKYDPSSEIATIHNRLVDYQANQGALLGTALVLVGTIAVVALASRSQSCYENHIGKFRKDRERTHNNIWNSDEKGVGSKRWRQDIDHSHGDAMRELERAFACLR